MTIRCVLGWLLTVAIVIPLGATDLTSFAAVEKEAKRLNSENFQYTNEFVQAVRPSIEQALPSCFGAVPVRIVVPNPWNPPHATKDGHRLQMILIVSAAGRIERTLSSIDSPAAVCLMKSVQLPSELPHPSQNHWPIEINLEW